jgi:hypothetical protein
MPRLAVGADQLRHQRVLGNLRNAGRDELARFHFVDMAVPQGFLVGRQAGKQPVAHDVLQAHELCVLCVTVIDDALDYVLVEDRAVVVRHLLLHTAVVKVNAVEVRIDGGDRRHALQRRRASFECRHFRGLVSTGRFHRRAAIAAFAGS